MPPLRIWVAQITGLPASMQLGAGTGWDFDFAAPCKSMGKSMEILLNARNVHCENNAHPSAPHPPPLKGLCEGSYSGQPWWGKKSRQPKVGGGRPPSWEPTNSLLASPLPPSSSPLYKKKSLRLSLPMRHCGELYWPFVNLPCFARRFAVSTEKKISHVLP